MAEKNEEVESTKEKVEDEDNEDNPDYKPPAPKSLDEILQADQEDESLRKYKEALLGTAGKVIVDDSNPLNVIVKKLAIIVEGRPDMELDLTMSKDQIKQQKIVLKEGVKYRVKIFFHVQREIVAGLKYEQKVYRKGIRVDKGSHMVGSYGPQQEIYSYMAPEDEAPSGLMARGDYKVESRFTDDDKHIYLEWEWHLTIKKDWAE